VKQSAQAKVLERKWLRFLLVHGEEYGFDESTGPTVELVEKFVTYHPVTFRCHSLAGAGSRVQDCPLLVS